MKLKKPVRLSLSRQVLNEMETYIRQGQWSIGDKIPSEPELAESFSVSHNTVREAVQSLIHAGILEARPGDGTYVIANDRFAVAMSNKLREAELSKILEARLALEKEIVRLAARNATEEDLKRIRKDLEKCLKKDGQGIEDDMTFHLSIAEATRNPVIAELYRVIVRHIEEHLGPLLEQKQYDPAALRLHIDLLEALRRQDADEAEAIVIKIVEFDTVSISA